MTEPKCTLNAQIERVFHFGAFHFIHKYYTAHQLKSTNKINNKVITALTSLEYERYKQIVQCTNTAIGVYILMETVDGRQSTWMSVCVCV